MAIPDYQSVMLPLLKLVGAKSTISTKDAIEGISDQFNLSPEERSTLLPSGKQEIIVNRVGWARTYMKKAGLLTTPQRGTIAITDRGKQVLAEKPPTINVGYLNRFPEFEEFRTVEHVKENGNVKPIAKTPVESETPEELLENSYQELKASLLDGVLPN